MLVWLNEVRLPGVHAPNCSVTDCDELFVERKLLSIGSILHVCVKEEEWEVVSRDAIDGKESETENLRGHPWSSRCVKGMFEADSELHPRIFKSEASILIEVTINSAKKLVVEPPVTVDLSFCLAALHDVSCVSLLSVTVSTAVV